MFVPRSVSVVRVSARFEKAFLRTEGLPQDANRRVRRGAGFGGVPPPRVIRFFRNLKAWTRSSRRFSTAWKGWSGGRAGTARGAA